MTYLYIIVCNIIYRVMDKRVGGSDSIVIIIHGRFVRKMKPRVASAVRFTRTRDRELSVLLSLLLLL